MKIVLFLFYFLPFFTSCAQNTNATVKIIPLHILTQTDTFHENNKTSINHIEHFLVETNNNDTAKIYKAIEDYVKKNASLKSEYYEYEMNFYMASKEVNFERINKYPETVTDLFYSPKDPHIITYDWFSGSFAGVIKYNKGIIIKK